MKRDNDWWAGLMMLCWIGMPGSLASAAEPPPALSVFRHAPSPGGVAVVDLQVDGSAAPTVMFGDASVAVAGDQDSGWWAILGIDLKTRPGTHRLVVTTDAGDESRVPVIVEPRSYEEQRITLKNKRQVNPSPVDMVRIRRESAKIASARRSRGEQLMAESFQWPVEGPISSPFGLRRFFNGEARRPHGGIDIAMPTGTPIVAPADGIVVDTGEYFFNGNSVFIEHGLGLQSFYAHLSRIDVQAGDTVTAGQTIGAIGRNWPCHGATPALVSFVERCVGRSDAVRRRSGLRYRSDAGDSR